MPVGRVLRKGRERAPGLTWVPTVVGGAGAFAIERGPLGEGLLRASQGFWRACAEAGIDQVVDDTWLFEDQALGLKALLAPVPAPVACAQAILAAVTDRRA